MTYEQLLRKFDNWGVEHPYVQPWKDALFEVVKLHMQRGWVCAECNKDSKDKHVKQLVAYPCSTIQAIEEKLK